MERNFYQAMIISNNSASIFWKSWITVALILLCVWILARPLIRKIRASRKAANGAARPGA